MTKVWINPSFKDKVKEEKLTEIKLKKPSEKTEKPPERKRKQKLAPQTRNAIHSDNYMSKRIRENTIVEFSFVNNMNITGCIEWFDQRYIKIIEAKTGDNVLIERRHIKYIKKKILL